MEPRFASGPPPDVWLALLPAPTQPAAPLWPDEPAEDDPASAARKAAPLTRSDFFSAFRHLPFQRAVFALEPYVPFVNQRALLRLLVATVPMVAEPFVFIPDLLASGLFSTRGVATGASAAAIFLLVVQLAVPARFDVARTAWRTLDRHPMAGYVRWASLAPAHVEGTSPYAAPGGPWIAHEEGDPMCPCPAARCAGDVGRKSGRLQLASALLLLVPGTAVWGLLFQWTYAVTLATTTWSNPGKALLVAWNIFGQVIVHFAVYFETIPSDLALLDLEARIRHRAVRLALAPLVARCSAAGVVAAEGAAEPWMSVHRGLAPALRTIRDATDAVTRSVFILIFALCIVSLVPLIGSGCIPAYLIGAAGLYVVVAVRFLSDAAASNAGLSSLALLYRRARNALLAACARSPPPADADWLLAQARLLERFEAATAGDLARFAGFPVDLPLFRGMLATGLTVGVGLFGILRGAGASVTLQAFCPV